MARGANRNNGPQLKPPLRWHLRRLWKLSLIPLLVAVIVGGWIYIPFLEARSQQNALASAFFEACRKGLKDTAQLPNVPEEALQEALKRRTLTNSAIDAWSPQVSAEVRGGKWIARIAFDKSAGYSVEQTIGPALEDTGYDSASAGP